MGIVLELLPWTALTATGFGLYEGAKTGSSGLLKVGGALATVYFLYKALK